MASRRPFDHRLRLKKIPVQFLSGDLTTASAEGNNAAVALCLWGATRRTVLLPVRGCVPHGMR